MEENRRSIIDVKLSAVLYSPAAQVKKHRRHGADQEEREMILGMLGIRPLLAAACLMSRKQPDLSLAHSPFRPVPATAIALLMLRAPLFRDIFLGLNSFVMTFQEATQAGPTFVFGYLGGGPLPFAETRPGASFSLAFQALPLVLVIAALTALLYYWRILPRVVRGFSWVLRKSMGIGGALGVVSSGCIFLGMIESP